MICKFDVMHNNTQLSHDPQNAMAKLSNVIVLRKYGLEHHREESGR